MERLFRKSSSTQGSRQLGWCVHKFPLTNSFQHQKMTNQSNFRGLIAELFQSWEHKARKGIYARKLNPFLPEMKIKTGKKKPSYFFSMPVYYFLGKRVKMQFRAPSRWEGISCKIKEQKYSVLELSSSSSGLGFVGESGQGGNEGEGFLCTRFLNDILWGDTIWVYVKEKPNTSRC